MEEQVTRVRFPNESYYDELSTFKLDDFTLVKVYPSEVFGIWHDIRVFVDVEDYNKLLKIKKINENSY